MKATAGTCRASGCVRAAAAAVSSSRPMPSCLARSRNVADMEWRCGSRPGVPARASRKGETAATDWLAFSSARPTSRSRVWASSTRRTSGR